MIAFKSARLLCILDRPTQYDVPLWEHMARTGNLQPIVWYLKAGSGHDPEIGKDVSWSNDPRNAAWCEVVDFKSVSSRLRKLPFIPGAVLTPPWRHPVTRVALFEAWRKGIPVILPSDKILDEPDEPSSASLRRIAVRAFHACKARLFSGFLCTGTLSARELIRLGIPQDRIATGLYPIDCNWWADQKTFFTLQSCDLRRRVLRENPGGKVILAVTKLSDREDPMLILEAFSCFHRADTSARLILVGGGPLQTAVRDRVIALGLENVVHLAGYVRYSNLPTYYGAADVFIHCPMVEPWGISVGEAMASGLPVVVTSSVGSAVDLVVSGRTGLVVNSRSPVNIANALECVLRKVSGQPGLGHALATTVSHLDVGRVSRDIASLVERLHQPSTWEPVLRTIIAGTLRRNVPTPNPIPRGQTRSAPGQSPIDETPR